MLLKRARGRGVAWVFEMDTSKGRDPSHQVIMVAKKASPEFSAEVAATSAADGCCDGAADGASVVFVGPAAASCSDASQAKATACAHQSEYVLVITDIFVVRSRP